MKAKSSVGDICAAVEAELRRTADFKALEEVVAFVSDVVDARDQFNASLTAIAQGLAGHFDSVEDVVEAKKSKKILSVAEMFASSFGQYLNNGRPQQAVYESMALGHLISMLKSEDIGKFASDIQYLVENVNLSDRSVLIVEKLDRYGAEIRKDQREMYAGRVLDVLKCVKHEVAEGQEAARRNGLGYDRKIADYFGEVDKILAGDTECQITKGPAKYSGKALLEMVREKGSAEVARWIEETEGKTIIIPDLAAHHDRGLTTIGLFLYDGKKITRKPIDVDYGTDHRRMAALLGDIHSVGARNVQENKLREVDCVRQILTKGLHTETTLQHYLGK